MTTTYRTFTRRLKSLQHDMLQTEMGQHMEYAGNVTQKSNEQNKWYHYMHVWLVESSMVKVLHKANFFLQQRIIFYLTIMVVVKHLEGSSNSIPIKQYY